MNLLSIAFQSCFLLLAVFACWKLALLAKKDDGSAEYSFLLACKGIGMIPWEVKIGDLFQVMGLVCDLLPSGRRGVKSLPEIEVSVGRFIEAEFKQSPPKGIVPFGPYRAPNGSTFYEGVSLLGLPSRRR